MVFPSATRAQILKLAHPDKLAALLGRQPTPEEKAYATAKYHEIKAKLNSGQSLKVPDYRTMFGGHKTQQHKTQQQNRVLREMRSRGASRGASRGVSRSRSYGRTQSSGIGKSPYKSSYSRYDRPSSPYSYVRPSSMKRHRATPRYDPMDIDVYPF